ncbi:MAG: DEAD/DEAH box helicase [Desulfobulbaceae bacterium]|nr:DEAD/DEAH box helicase [Desulfobulbaceae bacterium]
MEPTLTVSSDCLITGINFELEKQLKDMLTIDNPQYTAAKKYGRWIGKKLKPQLKYYDSVVPGLRFPRGFSNQAVLLCREHYGQDPRIIDERRLLPKVDFSFHGELRPYQEQAVGSCDNKSFGVIEAGTGSGKTVMALALIAARKQPTLVVVHTKELLYQWQQRVQQFLNIDAGLVGDGKFQLAPLTIAIVNTARKRVAELVPHFGHLVVDECHRVPASLFTDVVSAFDCHYLLGLSATAFRSDNEMTKLIYYFMGDRLHRVDKNELVATGAILAPEVIRRSTSFTYGYRGDYHSLIKALVNHEGRNIQIMNDIEKIAKEPDCGTILVVSDRVSHCQLFVDSLTSRGLNVELLSGQLAPELRSEVVGAVQRGEVQVLVATLQLISEGFDCPGLSTLFLTTPISFEGRLLQVIGRVMRPGKDKRARVFDYIDENIPTLMRSAQGRSLVLSQL